MIYRSKYPLVFALLLAAGMAGCIKEREVISAGGNGRPVIFSPQVSRGGESRTLAENISGQPGESRTLTGTRALPGHPIENVAGQTDAALIPDGKSFGVFAWVKETAAATATNFAGLQNMKVTRSGSEYTYTPTADWPRDPDATLSFFAYYPHSGSADADNRIAATRGTGADQWMRVAYTVSGDAGQHIDLMYAKTAMTAGYAPVNLNFGHALARLKFEGRTEGYPVGAVLKITGIKIKGATLEGELVVLDPTTQPGKPFWELSDAPAHKGDMTVPAAHIENVALTQTLQSVISAGGDMLVLPQSLGGMMVEVSASLNGTAFPQPFTFSLDGTPNWTMNEITTYEITLTPDGMRVAARVADWTTDPVNVIQDGQWWLSVNEDEHRFPAYGGEFTLTAETNYNIATQGYPAGLQVNASEIVYTPAVTPGSEWLTLTNETGANGDLTREIKITAANTAVTRTAKIKVQAGNLTKIVNLIQEYVPPSFPAYPGVIGYDPERGDLNLEGRGVMVYFKYGGIIAMYAGLSSVGNNKWDGATSIAFNPTVISDFTNYVTSFPIGNEGDYSTIGNVDVFHTLAGAKDGNGDPCRLVGFTAKYVKSELDQERIPDNGTWRLPTNAENGQATMEQELWVTQGSPSDATLRNGHTFIGLNKGTNFIDAAWNYLPAAGYRDLMSGSVSSQGSMGYYWSSTLSGTMRGRVLVFSSNALNTSNYDYQSLGCAVRCVRQP